MLKILKVSGRNLKGCLFIGFVQLFHTMVICFGSWTHKLVKGLNLRVLSLKQLLINKGLDFSNSMKIGGFEGPYRGV